MVNSFLLTTFICRNGSFKSCLKKNDLTAKKPRASREIKHHATVVIYRDII